MITPHQTRSPSQSAPAQVMVCQLLEVAASSAWIEAKGAVGITGCLLRMLWKVLADYPRGGNSRSIPLADVTRLSEPT